MKYFVYGVIGAVVVAIVVGFVIVGSPNEERMRNLDEQRANDLQGLQYEIVNYWQAKDVLPATLSDIKDDIRGVRVPADPETNAPYEYAVKGNLQFELCAVFARASNEADSEVARPVGLYGGINENWQHGAGRTCFARTIDKDLYPPLNKK